MARESLVAVLVVTLSGAIVGWGAENRAAADKRVSQAGVAVTLMTIGALSSVALLILALAIRFGPFRI